MSNVKLENIYKLLTENDFDANRNVRDEFKCGKCRKLLIEACQTRCGCRFCRSCIDEMMDNGCQFCPGIMSDCKIELLSTVQLDYIANKQISKLIMKCPKENCSFKCQLLEMSEHMRICKKNGLKCPFYKLGCDMKKMTNEKLIEHFQLENYNHSKILINMIDNIKNEVDELKERELNNHEEINKLKENLQSKDEKLQSINSELETMKMEKFEAEKHLKNIEEMLDVKISKLKLKHDKENQSIKTEKEELDKHMQIELRNIWNKIDEIELELMKLYENRKIESMKSDFFEEIDSLQGNFDKKIDEIESMNTKEIESINYEMMDLMKVYKEAIDKSIMKMGIKQKMNEFERNIENKIDGVFEMIIDNVDELRIKYFRITSEYFIDRMHPYKLRLFIDPSFSDDLLICLYIYDDLMNKYLPFPFTADVTMKIINKNNRELNKSITKYCQIEKPENNSFNASDKFTYSFSELTESGILESNCFIIECCVELK